MLTVSANSNGSAQPRAELWPHKQGQGVHAAADGAHRLHRQVREQPSYVQCTDKGVSNWSSLDLEQILNYLQCAHRQPAAI